MKGLVTKLIEIKSNQKQKRKEFLVITLGCVLCLGVLVAGTFMVGTIGKGNKKSDNGKNNIIDLNETDDSRLENETTGKQEETKSASKSPIENSNEKPQEEEYDDMPVDSPVVKETSGQHVNEVVKETPAVKETPGQQVNEVAGKAEKIQLNFQENCKLQMPVEGETIIDYSMDKTVYFKTLDTYKCSPAMVISSVQGAEVRAGVSGEVKKIGTDDEIGKYIVLNLGNGYELTFGQLENVMVSEGDYVTPEISIANVSAPTRFYAKEGNNLYYKLSKDGEPVNPHDFLEK